MPSLLINIQVVIGSSGSIRTTRAVRADHRVHRIVWRSMTVPNSRHCRSLLRYSQTRTGNVRSVPRPCARGVVSQKKTRSIAVAGYRREDAVLIPCANVLNMFR